MTDPTTAPTPDPESQFLERYHELRQAARMILSDEAEGCSVEATALVNHAFEKVFRGARVPDFNDTEHMIRILCGAMRQALVDRARRRNAVKRGGGERPVDVNLESIAAEQLDAARMLDLDDAMGQLAAEDPESARLVELYWFGGLTMKQTAARLGCSKSRADTIWLYARKWLQRALRSQA